MVAGPKKDEFAALLGIEVTRRGPGHTVAVLTTTEQHANPHGTVHGAVFYAVAGAAVAAAANDAEFLAQCHDAGYDAAKCRFFLTATGRMNSAAASQMMMEAATPK